MSLRGDADEATLAKVERKVNQKWQVFEEDGNLAYQQRIVVALAQK
ncbi:MAG: hypothetical protein ACLFWD_04780 [Anaerolineales bacterium]